jgi:hypothetical protein
MKTAYSIKGKMGRSMLKGKTPVLVTHLLQNEKWLNDQIGLHQRTADEALERNDLKVYKAACDKVADLIGQHRLFVAELLPYCLPKLSATLHSDNDEASKLISELMSVKSKETKHSDSAIVTPEAPDADE